MRRRELVFERPDPPDYRMLLDESVLRRDVGGLVVAADQLEALLDFIRKRHLKLRILPFSASAGAAKIMIGAFLVLDLDDQDAVLYREIGVEDEVIHAVDQVERYRRDFDDLWESALSEEASKRLVEVRRAELLAAISGAK